jgi:hypothetical protein
VGILLAIGAVVAVSSPTKAAIYGLDFRGTVTQGIDGLGLFGPIASSLAGSQFDLVYSINSDLGVLDVSPPQYQALLSGPFYGLPVAVTATMTINGVAYTQGFQALGVYVIERFDPPEPNSENGALNYYGELSGLVQYGPGEIPGASDLIGARINAQVNSIGSPASAFPASLFVDFALGVDGTHYQSSAGSFFDVFDNTRNTPGATHLDLGITCVTGTLAADIPIACVSDQSAVPEPSLWAMMLLGFGSLGAMMRSRRKLARGAA